LVAEWKIKIFGEFDISLHVEDEAIILDKIITYNLDLYVVGDLLIAIDNQNNLIYMLGGE